MTAPPGAAAGGLTELAVRTRVDTGQVNSVPPAPGRSLAQILRANVLTRFNAILGALFVVVLVIGPPQDALFGAVLVVNTVIGVARELRAEGRRVVANIERVAGLFVTKTVYAAIVAVAVGVAGITYPFFPRHLTIISTLTIGVPGFFLALGRGAPRARPGFTRRVLSFTIPAGVATAAAALASYLIARSAGYAAASRTAATLAVFAMGLWVLVLVAGRPTASRIFLIAALTLWRRASRSMAGQSPSS
jgi:magnesium-transporting ATPase (P-type)